MTVLLRELESDLGVALPRYTGGQYSLARAAMGMFLALHLIMRIPRAWLVYSDQGVLSDGRASPILGVVPNLLTWWDQPAMVHWMLLVAIGLSLLLIIGWYDRIAAGLLWYVLACLHARNPMAGGLAAPLIGWALIVHMLLPASPYGSIGAWRRTDPRGRWIMPVGIYGAVWFLLALAYFHSGLTHWNDTEWTSGETLYRATAHPWVRPEWVRDAAATLPRYAFRWIAWAVVAVELGMAPLALFPRARPILWAWTLVFHQAILASIIFDSANVGVLMLHLITFHPTWVPPRPQHVTETVFYDGSCGLCHRTVRFLLAEDADGDAFRFAPLGGQAFDSMLSEQQRQDLPDSFMVLTGDGQLLVRSNAIIHALRRLGGMWAIGADFLTVVPRILRDAVYNVIAAVRYRLFRRPPQVCPVIPDEWRHRFAA